METGAHVITPNGRAVVVAVFPSGQIAVQYPWGAGAVLLPSEVRLLRQPTAA
jgi:hypothetical protein